MNAQDLLREIEIEEKKKPSFSGDDFYSMFYPEIWKQRQADKNISLICKGVLR